MQERVRSVRPSDGSSLDNLRAASERLEAALGGPAVEAIKPFREECVTCEHLCDGGNDAAACDAEVCPHAEGCMEPETLAAIDAACGEPVRLPERMLTPKPQSYNPMMVGYVPPVNLRQ